MTPEDTQIVKDIIKSDIAKPTEPWSWYKFFTGFFNGRNYAKAIVIGVCMAIVLTICFSVYSVIKSRFAKQKPGIVQTEQVGTNTGTINKADSHDSTEKKGWQLFGGLVQVNN